MFQTCAAAQPSVFRERAELHDPSQFAALLVRQRHPEPVHAHRLCTLNLNTVLLYLPIYHQETVQGTEQVNSLKSMIRLKHTDTHFRHDLK